jgi:hypothetical protein
MVYGHHKIKDIVALWRNMETHGNGTRKGLLMTLDPKYLTLDDLLQKRLFKIPEYQRAYSWGTKQRNDLFSDIEKLGEIIKTQKDRDHFMATVVCLERPDYVEVGTDQYRTLDVVDGQQRLTTLIVLLKEISKALREQDEVAEADNIDRLLVKGDKRLILLQTNHDKSYIFRDYLIKGIMPDERPGTQADFNLVKAARECGRFVAGWGKRGDLLDLLRLIKNRISFIFYITRDQGSVYNTFEVLNSRGLEVDWLDKCKSMLMGLAFEKLSREAAEEHIPELNKIWSKIYHTIGVREVPGHEILRFSATLRYISDLSRPLGTEESLEYYRRMCTEDPASTLEVSRWILQLAEKLRQLYLDHRLSGVTEILQARLLAVSVMLSEQWTAEQKRAALEEWEKVTFRIYGLARKDARTKVGEYTRLAYHVYNDLNQAGWVPEVLIKIRRLGREKEYHIDNVVEGLRNSDCYNGWGGELRYFLYRYEEYLAGRAGATINNNMWEAIWRSSTASTIEHIRPKKWDAKGWKGVLGGSKEAVELRVNQLGNLMLLPPGVNAKAAAKSFAKKKNIYRRQGNLLQIEEVLQEKSWSGKQIKDREERMLAWARKHWGN